MLEEILECSARFDRPKSVTFRIQRDYYDKICAITNRHSVSVEFLIRGIVIKFLDDYSPDEEVQHND